LGRASKAKLLSPSGFETRHGIHQMEQDTIISAIQELAEGVGLYFDMDCDSPDPSEITVHLVIPTGDAHVLGDFCRFDRKLVIEWLKNGKIEGKQHMIARINECKGRVLKQYKNNR
jgi:hypothetical protein